jgi:transposase-like protein
LAKAPKHCHEELERDYGAMTHAENRRTTNVIERLNEEFRRRVKTRWSFPTEGSALTLLSGLIASGTIQLRKIEGYQKLAEDKGGPRSKRRGGEESDVRK